MLDTSFTFDTRMVTTRLRTSPRAIGNAVNKAGGDALRAMRSESSRKIRARKAIKAATVSDKLTLVFPQDSEVKAWRLRIPAETMPVIGYSSARQTKRGVSVLINVGKRVVIPHAFIATMRSGHKGVFVRYGQAVRTPTQRYRGNKRYAGQKRQPIRELYTSRIIDVAFDRGFQEDVLARGQAVLKATYDRVLPLEIAKVFR